MTTQTQARPHVRTMLPPAADEVQGRRAGIVTRTGVMVVDVAVVALTLGAGYLTWVSARFMRKPASFSWPTVGYSTVIVGAAVICVVYLTVAWSTTGRSVGKRVFGLRIVTRDGERLHAMRAFLRALACTLFPMLLYWAAVSRQNRSVQDLVFRTSVVYDWRSRGRAAHPAPATTPLGEDAVGSGVDVAPAVADETDDRHPESLPRLDGE